MSGFHFKNISFFSQKASSVVTDGLVVFLDANNTISYAGGGTRTWNSLSPATIPATINGSFSFSSSGIRLNNTSTDRLANTARINCNTISNIRTVSLWYFTHGTAATRYLLDMRPGGSGGWVYDGGFGSNWASGTLYVNGGNAQGMNWNSIESGAVNNWRNVTVVNNTGATDALHVFSRFSNNEGYNVTAAIILVYNRVITQAENTANFNHFRARFGL